MRVCVFFCMCEYKRFHIDTHTKPNKYNSAVTLNNDMLRIARVLFLLNTKEWEKKLYGIIAVYNYLMNIKQQQQKK